MIVITGNITRTRAISIKDKKGAPLSLTFVELLVEWPDRASQTYEVKLPDGMDVDQFKRGMQATIAIVPIAGEQKRLYLSALTNQPPGFPKIEPHDAA